MDTRPTPAIPPAIRRAIRPTRRAAQPARPALLLALLASAAMLQACNRNDSRTVGQKVDDSVARTERKADDIKVDAREASHEVRQSMGNASDNAANKTQDLAITTQVKSKLAGDSQLSALAINVDTASGRVVLRGVTPDTASRSRATELARAVDGVSAVDNDLSVQAR